MIDKIRYAIWAVVKKMWELGVGVLGVFSIFLDILVDDWKKMRRDKRTDKRRDKRKELTSGRSLGRLLLIAFSIAFWISLCHRHLSSP